MKLEINYKKKTGKSTNMCRINNMLLNNQWVNKEIKRVIEKYFQTTQNGNTTHQNLSDAVKVVLRGKFTAINTHLKNKQTNKVSKTP